MLQDSISIAIKFQDGDGNLGIAAEEIGQPPFQKRISCRWYYCAQSVVL